VVLNLDPTCPKKLAKKGATGGKKCWRKEMQVDCCVKKYFGWLVRKTMEGQRMACKGISSCVVVRFHGEMGSPGYHDPVMLNNLMPKRLDKNSTSAGLLTEGLIVE